MQELLDKELLHVTGGDNGGVTLAKATLYGAYGSMVGAFSVAFQNAYSLAHSSIIGGSLGALCGLAAYWDLPAATLHFAYSSSSSDAAAPNTESASETVSPAAPSHSVRLSGPVTYDTYRVKI